MFGNSDLLEEIVETTEEQEADLCSSGETVDECTILPISDYVEESESQQQQQHHHHHSSSKQHQSTLAATVVPSVGSQTTTNASSGSSSSSSSTTTTTGRQHKSSRSAANSTGSAAGGGGSGSQHHANNGHHHHASLNGAAGRTSSSSSSSSARSHMEQEKRMRREIANSNERRRMQSINAGFQSLRTLLPHHEGEKLSKAAILQQTAEYIYQLEQQKTQLLSQNLQLKRLVDQHEGGDVPTKKRKCESQGVVVSLPVHVSESGDEGLGSMSPEPLSVITVSADGHASVAASSEMAELKRQLERERAARAHLEKQIRSMQNQLFPERFREEQLIAYQPHEVIEHTNNVLPQELEEGMPGLQVVSVVSVPTVGSTQTVETSNADSNTPPLSPQPGCEIIVPSSGGAGGSSIELDGKEVNVGELLQIDSRPNSPKIVGFASVPVFESQMDDQASSSSFGPGTTVPVAGVTYATANLPVVTASAVTAEFITASPTRPFSPEQDPAGAVVAAAVVAQQQVQTQTQQQQQSAQPQQRLPSVLEAAIKAEPKVEVERLPSPSNSLDDGTPQARLYMANTSRQNLETIVEAIRHLEGDHLFSDEPAQDAPLALTNKPSSSPNSKQRLLHAEVNSFLQFHTTSGGGGSSSSGTAAAVVAVAQQQPTSTPASSSPASTAPPQPQSRTQQRPGVIVVKHS